MPTVCPDCGGRKLSYAGTGTQRIAAELEKLYPSARVLRMDNDTTSGKEGHYKILKAFGEKRADILVGTQMIAKGHDFPSVTLVGILDADMSLHFSDYRSGERTFQLITQVAGRSGRAEEAGKVVLQTYDPENYILRFAVNYDYAGFYKHEIALRKATAFPPFATIVRVMATGEEEAKVAEVLKAVYSALKELYDAQPGKFLFFNKMKAPVKRIQNKVRSCLCASPTGHCCRSFTSVRSPVVRATCSYMWRRIPPASAEAAQEEVYQWRSAMWCRSGMTSCAKNVLK